MNVVFLDRDGTLIDEPEDCKVDSIDKLVFKPGVFDALRLLRDHGYELVVVSNQDGIGRPEFSWEAFDAVQEIFLKTFEERGVRFREMFVCPHVKEDGCECRKPEIGLVREFFWECEVDPKQSYMIGDRPTDVLFGKRLGVQTIYLNNPRFPLQDENVVADFTVTDIVEAAERILRG